MTSGPLMDMCTAQHCWTQLPECRLLPAAVQGMAASPCESLREKAREENLRGGHAEVSAILLTRGKRLTVE